MADRTIGDYSVIAPQIEQELSARPPRSVLAIGAPAVALLREALGPPEAAAAPLTALEEAGGAAAALPPLGVHDLAVVAGALEALPRREAEILVSRLRDLYARRVLVALAGTRAEAWGHADMIAAGFVLDAKGKEDATVALYAFDVATYKTTPDWLNAENWANPELFDKYRW